MMGITAKGYTGTYDAAAHGITVSGVPQGAAIKYGTVNGSYTKNTSPTYTNVGTYTVYWQVTKANYETVTGSQKIVISARTLTDTDVTTGAALTYNGAQQTQTISVTAGGRTLAQGTDYTVSGNTGTAAQTYTLTVMGKGNYAGTVKKQFMIAQKVLTTGMVSGVSASYIYMGSAIEPTVTIKDGNKTLAVGTDYTIAYQNNTSAGTASVTVTGKGNYKGTVTKTFQITPKTLTADMVSGVSESYIYTGSAIEPAITVKDGIKILVSGTDYTVTYKDNTSAGTASVTVAGTGNYGGTVVKNFTIRYNPLPDGKTLEDYVTVSPEPKNGWYGADIILDAVMGITIGETPAAAGGQIAFTQETGTQNVTKTIYIKDKDGSIYETQFSYKLDKTPPVIDLSNKTVTNGKGVWNWIVGKTGMTIEIPKADITDDLSGVAQVGYAAADDSGVQQTGTVAVKGERYVITLAQEFSGTIKITATDYAGNTSEISLVADGGKVVAEDTAPTITTDVSEGYYETPTELTVTVSDDTENVITAGIASVTYQVDNGAEQSVAVDGTALQENITFKIPASEIPTGVSKITVCATDNAGNTATAEITVKVKGPEHTPDAEINYRNELLTGLVAGADYVINGTRNMTADENGSISIQEEWLGTTLRIVKKGNNVETLDSATQSLPIPSRPTAPDAPEKSSCTESAITVKENAGAEYRADGGAWQAQTQFAGLTEKTVYTFTARYAATDTSFVSLESVGTQMATMPEPPAADKFAIDYVAETFLLKDGVEAFADAECTVSAAEGSVNAYMGATVYIRYPENGIIPRSNTTAVEIPQRPDAPTLGTTDASYPTAQDGALTGLDASYAYEIRKEGGAWKDAVLTETQIRGLGAGTYEVRVKATQASCFYGETARADIGEEPAKPEKEPQAVIEYRKEILSGLVPDGEYTINGEPVKADENGEIAIKEKWFGKTHEIVKKSEGAATTDSSAQSLPIPLRPGAPDAPEKSSCTESTITVKPNAGMEYRADGGGWQSQTQFAGLTEKTVYTFTARYAATDTSFVSLESASTQIATMPEPPTADKLVIDYVAETFLLKDGAEAFADAGCAASVAEGSVNAYMGATMYLRYPEKGIVPHSRTTAVEIPQRPQAPTLGVTNASYPGAQDGTLTGLYAAFAYEIRKESGKWESAILTGTQIRGLGAGTYEVRVKATQDVCFYGETARADIGEEPTMPEKQPQAVIDYEKGVLTGLEPGGEYVINGELVKANEKGEIPIKDDWYDKTMTIVKKGNGADKSDSEPQSVVVPPKKVNTYTVTLSGGKGYTLTALEGSTSPIDEGKSYAFQFALAKGYQKTKSFAVKVNGVKVSLTAQNTYTIQDIRENKMVTVEGVKKKSSGGSSGDSSGGSSDGSSGGNSGSGSGSSGSTPKPPSKTPETTPTQGTPQEAETPGADSTNPEADNEQTTAPGKDAAETQTDKPEQDSQSELNKGQADVQNNLDENIDTDDDTDPQTQPTDQNTQTSPEAAAIEKGAVTVTVNNVDETACTAKVADAAAIAGAVLTQEELATAVAGEGIEIRIDVARMEDVPPADAQVIEQGVAAYQDIFPDMNMGMYIDISMFMRKGSGGWNAVHTTNEPVEIVMDIPQELASLSADFYILRAHEGAYLLLEDLDDNPATITIKTEAFSTYAITYQRKDGAGKQPQGMEIADEEAQSFPRTTACSLCHICPTILGICCFIWLAVLVIIVALAAVFVSKKKHGQKKN